MKTRRLIKRSQSKRSQSKRTIKKYKSTRKYQKSKDRRSKTMKRGGYMNPPEYQKKEQKQILNGIKKFNTKIKHGEIIKNEEITEICDVLDLINPKTKFYKNIDPKEKYYEGLKSAIESARKLVLFNIDQWYRKNDKLFFLRGNLDSHERENAKLPEENPDKNLILSEDKVKKTKEEIEVYTKEIEDMPSFDELKERKEKLQECFDKHKPEEAKPEKTLYEVIHRSQDNEEQEQEQEQPIQPNYNSHELYASFNPLKPKSDSITFGFSPRKKSEFGFKKGSKGSMNLSPDIQNVVIDE